MEIIAPQVKQYVGIDFSKPFIDEANFNKKRLNIKNAKFECGDINEFCQRNKNNFDIIFAMDISEHIYDLEWLEILQNIHNALNNNGILYLHTPNASFFLEKMKKHNFIFKQFPEHIAVRTLEHNFMLLKQAGFTVNYAYLLAHYNQLKIFHILSYLPRLKHFFGARIFIVAKKLPPALQANTPIIY
jgi:2-polyprenyl-3-methyl-5-hydroxy-6-metoxy-1,4-benzoquinol methylase